MTNEEYILFLLKKHRRMKADIKLLWRELQMSETLDETIEALCFHGQEYGDRIQSNSIKDITANIALVFRKENERATRCMETREETVALLEKYTRAVEFIDMALEQLKALNIMWYNVISELCIEGKLWEQFMEEHYVSRTTVKRIRRQALNLIVEWWGGATPL